MKLFERHETDKTLEQLPELPPDVQVPDDISTIHPPATHRPTIGGVRWMRWLAVILLLGAAGGVTALVLTSGDATETPTQGPVDLMEIYGTDNPNFVPDAAGPRSVEIAPAAPAADFMELYGTDNPALVPGAAEANSTAHDDFMRLYGTDNPAFVEVPPMQEFGTDNPSHLP